MRILFIGDAHLGRGVHPQLVSDAYTALDKIASDLSDVSAIIFAGDTLDSNKLLRDDVSALDRFIFQAKKTSTAIYAIGGNHDISNPILGFEYIKELTLKGVELEGKIVRGISYGSTHRTLEAIKSIEGHTDILVMHASFTHLLGFEDESAISIDMFDGLDINNVIVGHVHVQDIKKSKDCTVYSTGSLVPQNIAEAHSKHGYVEFANHSFSYTLVKLREYKSFTYPEDSLKSISSYLSAHNGSYVYIKSYDGIPEELSNLCDGDKSNYITLKSYPSDKTIDNDVSIDISTDIDALMLDVAGQLTKSKNVLDILDTVIKEPKVLDEYINRRLE